MVTWQKLTPLSIEDIQKESEMRLEIDDDEMDVTKFKFKSYVTMGQFKKGTNVAHGVARRIFDSTVI